jgi:presenilin-like A22 family membrane protease
VNENRTLVLLLLIFLSVNALGLYTGYQYAQAIDAGVLEPAFENPEETMNAVIIFAYILAITGVIILIIRYKKSLLRVLEAIAIFVASDIVFEFLIPYALFGVLPIGLVLALILTVVKYRRPTFLTQDIALIFTGAGAGAVIGVSFGVLPVLVFILMLSIYDFFSVFISKHMVYMAKAITETPMAFTAALPTDFGKPRPVGKARTRKKVHVFQLGGGDLVIPLVFAVSVMRWYGLGHALFAVLGAMVAMILLFAYVLRKPGIPLPALPPVSAGACLGFVISTFLI